MVVAININIIIKMHYLRTEFKINFGEIIHYVSSY